MSYTNPYTNPYFFDKGSLLRLIFEDWTLRNIGQIQDAKGVPAIDQGPSRKDLNLDQVVSSGLSLAVLYAFEIS